MCDVTGLEMKNTATVFCVEISFKIILLGKIDII